MLVKALTYDGLEPKPIWIYHFKGQTWGTSRLDIFNGDVACLILDRLGIPEAERNTYVEAHGLEAVRYETTEHAKREEHRNLNFTSSLYVMYHQGLRHAEFRAKHGLEPLG